MNSVLKTRRLINRSGSSYQPECVVNYRNAASDKRLVFPKAIGKLIRDGKFCHLEYKVNEIEHIVYLLFYNKPSDESIKIELDEHTSDNNNRKLVVRNKSLIEYMKQDLDIISEQVDLELSKNLSNNSDFLSFKITK